MTEVDKQVSERLRVKFDAWELLFELYALVLDIPEITVEEDDGE